MKNTVKSKKSDVMNLYHPSISGDIDYAFTANKVKYYCFKSDSEIRYGRYVVLQAFLQEYYLRMDLDTLRGYIKKMNGWMNPPITKEGGGTIQLGKVQEMLSMMEQRTNIAFEPDTVFRLASCLYFDDKEILSKYDKAYNEKKIASWKETGTVDFFFHKVFKELTQLTVTSKEDLESYLTQVPELLKGWSTIDAILLP